VGWPSLQRIAVRTTAELVLAFCWPEVAGLFKREFDPAHRLCRAARSAGKMQRLN